MEQEHLKKFLEYDYYETPLFDGLQFDVAKRKLKKSGNMDIFLGTRLYKVVNEFTALYRAKCKEFGVKPQPIKRMAFADVVPYCSAVTAACFSDDAIACMMYMQDHFGKYEDQLLNNIVKSDALREIASQLDGDADLRRLVELYADLLDVVDKILMYDYEMGGLALDEKWQDIADALNGYVDKLIETKLGTKRLKHFTADDACRLSKISDLYAIPPFVEKKDGKYGLTGLFGEQILPFEWDYIDEFHEGFAVIGSDSDKKCGYVNTKGEIVIPRVWDLAFGFSEGYAVVCDDEHRHGVINRNGKVVIPCKWRFITPFENGLAKAQDFDEHWYSMNTKGETTRVYTYQERKEMGMLTEEEQLQEKMNSFPDLPPDLLFDNLIKEDDHCPF